MKILEIFDSIQGEGQYMGMPCTFVRTAGCSLRCSFCDTKLSWAEGTSDMSPEDIAAKCSRNFVVITGGEPTEQPIEELNRLIHILHRKGKFVAMESNGTFEDYTLIKANWITVSPKANASYAVFRRGISELKYVVTEEFDANVAISEYLRENFKGHIWLQPCDYADAQRNAEMCHKAFSIAMSDSRLRCGVQLHKVYGVA